MNDKPTYTDELSRIHDRLDSMERNQTGLTGAITDLTMRMEKWFGNDVTETSGKFQRAEDEAVSVRGKLDAHIDLYDRRFYNNEKAFKDFLNDQFTPLRDKVIKVAGIILGLSIAAGGAAGHLVSLLFG